jgi:hypothetical protein
VFVRDGDDLILKTSLRAGRAPFRLEWSHEGRPVAWSGRLAPYNREGCVGLRVLGAGPQDEGSYSCTVSNSEGAASFTCTLLVDCEFPPILTLLSQPFSQMQSRRRVSLWWSCATARCSTQSRR